MEKKNFNIAVYLGKMLICASVWTLLVCIILTILAEAPEKIVTFEFPPNDKLTLNVYFIIGIITAVVAHYFLVFETKTYYYSFQTKCNNPVMWLIINIIFGSFVCSIVLHLFGIDNASSTKIMEAYYAISVINYFIFCNQHGNELRETSFVDEWTKNMH